MMWSFISWDHHISSVDTPLQVAPNSLLRHLSLWKPVQEAYLMIGHSRDINLLSTIVIMFLIGGLKLFFADMNGFPFKMVFAGYWHCNFCGNTACISDVNKPITFVNSKINFYGSLSKFWSFVFLIFSVFSPLWEIFLGWMSWFLAPKISSTSVKADLLQLHCTENKKFFIRNFFSKCDQIRSKSAVSCGCCHIYGRNPL